MPLTRAFIPYGAWWSTPFTRWQGALAAQHPLELAAACTRDALAARGIAAAALDALVLGTTVPSPHAFYGAPWLAGMAGLGELTGPTLSQACATGAAVLAHAAVDVETGGHQCVLGVAGDRTSWGPHLYYPSASGPGGRGEAEDWVWDNFQKDPFAGNAMIDTAERLAAEAGISREEQEELTALRHQQYQEALADGRAFQRRYLRPVTLPRGRKETVEIATDEGVRPAAREVLAGQRTVRQPGTVTPGTQTFPADGNAGVVITTAERAAELAPSGSPRVRLVGFGSARVGKGRMPEATVPAARRALDQAGFAVGDCAAVKLHNPFAVNDVWFCRQLDLAPTAVNRYGSPLVWGHPQGPTGLRCVIEVVEELVARGGGRGLFSGCAAGDTAMAVAVEVA